MALSKLAHRLREHDWFAGLIELLIVIVGILIALQVSNWNQDRQDLARARQYEQRLHRELQADLREMKLTDEFWSKVAGYQAQASTHAESGKLAGGSAWRTLLAYYQSSQLRPFELEDTTFVELRDAGELHLLGDDTLSKGLADYYRNTGAGMQGEILRHSPEYRVQIRGLVPYAVQEYVWAKCWRQRARADQELIDCPSPIPEAEAAALVESFRSNDQLIQKLRFWRAQMHVSVIIVRNIQAQARTLDGRVQELVARAAEGPKP
jgi:type II secretory pathway pseudopilin PulG